MKTAKQIQDVYIDMPYYGLFGDTNQIRVIRQVVADPYGDYRPKELEALVEASAPSVRRVLKNLTRVGLLIKDMRDKQHPVYRVNVDSPIYLALTFLAFAIRDHKNSTHYMSDVIADYYDSELREQYESYDIVTTINSNPEIISDREQSVSDAYLKHSKVSKEETPIAFAPELDEMNKAKSEYAINPHVIEPSRPQSAAAA